jgi:hypothetical protein
LGFEKINKISKFLERRDKLIKLETKKEILQHIYTEIQRTITDYSENLYSHKLKNLSQALVDHPCNPSYSGGRDQEDRGSKPAQGNIL